VVGRGQFRLDDFAGQLDGQGRALGGQLFHGRGRRFVDLLQGPGMFGLGLGLGPVEQLAPGLLGLAPALVQHRADLPSGFRQLALIVGQQLVGLPVGRFGLGDVVGHATLALVQSLDDRLPGETPKNRHHAEKDHGGPQRQIGLPLQRIDRPGVFASGGGRQQGRDK